MSYVPPDPPPPPPPPAPPAGPAVATGFDFLEPFTFLFRDPRWVPKILIGGLFHLASILIIGIFFVLGYCARLARNVVAGMEHPAPEWDDLGEYLTEGLRLFFVVLLYALPFMAIAGFFLIPAALAGAFSDGRHDLSGMFASGITGCSVCFVVPLGLALSFWLPGALLMSAIDRSFAAAFDFGRIYRFISTNFVNYLLAFLVYLVARFATGFGLLLFCIGIFFAAFWAFTTSTYAFAQAYRLSQRR